MKNKPQEIQNIVIRINTFLKVCFAEKKLLEIFRILLLFLDPPFQFRWVGTFYFHLEQLHSVANVALNNNNNTINVTTTKQMLQVNATSETTDPGNDTDSSDPLRQLSQRAAKG